MQHVRVFISSPGDVVDERTFARQVVDQELPRDPWARGDLTCESVSWDDPTAPVATPATLTPQDAVNRGLPKPSDCDVVIVILWSRMGTPLPESWRKPDGAPYLSGTEWEYEDALNAASPPHILVYRRTTRVHIDPDDPAADQQLEQRRRVTQFFQRFQNPDGSLKGGYTTYDSPQEFRDLLRTHLRAYVRDLIRPRSTPITPPPPYGLIASALRAGKVIPIVGAGVVRSGRPPNARWDPAHPTFLPSGVELAQFLAEDTGFPLESDRDDLAKVASFYEAFGSRATLRDRLRQMLDATRIAPEMIPPAYSLLAAVPTPLLVITTNYDSQLEQAFRAAGKPYDLVVYPADRKDLANAVMWWAHGASEPRTPTPGELDVDLETTTVIFKIHGAVLPGTDEWDSFVITEEDHVELLARVAAKSAIPSVFGAHVHDRSLLFVGFSLQDWNLRLVMRSLARYFARRMAANEDDEIPSWAIDDQLSELEIKLWRRRGVMPHQLPIAEFIDKLGARMRA
jgi:hypothetical protein